MGRIREDLGDDLCEHCPLDRELRGTYSTPGGNSSGCEGSHCAEAYELYLDTMEE